MAFITPATDTVYSRDQLLALRSSPALLNHRACLRVSRLGLRRRGCRAGRRWRCRLTAAHSATSSVGLTCTPGEIPTIIGDRAAVVNNNQLIDRHDVHGTCTDLDLDSYAKQYSSSQQLVPTLKPHACPPLLPNHPKLRCPRSSSAAQLPVWSPAATACDVALNTMSYPVSAGRQLSPSSSMSTAPLPSLSVAAVCSTPIRSTSAAPTTTLTLPSTTAGHCQSGLTSLPPPPVHAVPLPLISLCNDSLSDSLTDNSIASTITTDINSCLQSPGSVVQLDSEPDSFSFDNSVVSNYHIIDLFSNSLTNHSSNSTPVEHNSSAISSHHSPTDRRFCSYFPRFWTCNVHGGLTSKIDEIAEVILTNGIDVAVLVETWHT